MEQLVAVASDALSILAAYGPTVATVARFLATFVAVFVLTALLGSGADAKLSKEFSWQFRLAASCRTPVLMFFVVPLSFVHRLRVLFGRWLSRKVFRVSGEAAARRHAESVATMASQLREWSARGRTS